MSATKYYRVKKGTHMWEAGTILKELRLDPHNVFYAAVEGVQHGAAALGVESVSSCVVESPLYCDYFERVYPAAMNALPKIEGVR